MSILLHFISERRPMLIDLILVPDDQFEKDRYLYTIHDSTDLTAECTIEKPDEKHVHIWGKASRLFDKDGNITGAIESIRDITERRRAETELRAAHEHSCRYRGRAAQPVISWHKANC